MRQCSACGATMAPFGPHVCLPPRKSPRPDPLTADERAAVENFRADVRCGYEIPIARRNVIVAILDRIAPPVKG